MQVSIKVSASILSSICILMAASISEPLAADDNLSQIYQLALDNDPSLKAAKAQLASGKEAAIQARAGLLPQLNAQYSYSETDYDSHGHGDIRTLQSLPNATDNINRTSSLILNQKLFDLNAWFNFKSGKKLSHQAEARFAAEQQDVIVRVAEAYFDVLKAQEVLASSQAEEKAIAQQLKQTRQRYDVGLVPMTDVHEATAAYDLSRVKRLSDQGRLGIAYEALSVLTGQRHQGLQDLKDDYAISGPQPANVEEWVNAALKNNWQLKAALLSSQVALDKAKASKASHLPTLSASLSYSDSKLDEDTWAGNSTLYKDVNNETKRVQINLDLPLYSGGAISSRRRQAYQDYYAAQSQETSAKRNLVQATRSYFLAVTTGAASVKAQKNSIVSAQSAIDATQAGYDVGTRNIVDVLNAQRALFAAKRDYASARYQYIIDTLKLKQQAGTLSPADIEALNSALQ